MIKPIGLEEFASVSPVAGPSAASTVSQLTDEKKRRLVWFLQWKSHEPGGLKSFAYTLVGRNPERLGSHTMHRLGFDVHTYFEGPAYELICDELNSHPLGCIEKIKAEFIELELRESFVDLLDYSAEEKDAQKARSFERRRNFDAEIGPKKRRQSAVTFLYTCREQALVMPEFLAGLCKNPGANWDLPYFSRLVDALEIALKEQTDGAAKTAAPTKISANVHDALDFAHQTKGLVVIHGVERMGKSEAARMWQAAHPEKARLISLSAATTDFLFYSEIFEALGCGEKKAGTSTELRSRIRETVQNRDLALIFDEAHCLFGLSEKASIKRLEYIRTEFVNRGIPVVLIITPQFAKRLKDLEAKTSFNVNQLRGRLARWVTLPPKPSRSDVECLTRFCLPGIDQESHALMTNFAMQSEYPFASVRHAVNECHALIAPGEKISPPIISKAIGHALFTASQLAETIPAPAPARRVQQRPSRRNFEQPPEAMHEASNAVANEIPTSRNGNSGLIFQESLNRAQSPALTV